MSQWIPISLFVVLLVPIWGAADGWKFDFSRRTQDIRKAEINQTNQRNPASVESESSGGFFDFLFESGEPVQELVLLNTENGFVPNTLRLKVGFTYQVHVVNVNAEKRNISFVLDSFSQHHATYYGQIKSFRLKPAQDGVYTYSCPETAAKGRLVVYPNQNTSSSPDLRSPASED